MFVESRESVERTLEVFVSSLSVFLGLPEVVCWLMVKKLSEGKDKLNLPP